MSVPKVDPDLFISRLERLYSSWENEGDNIWAEADALAVAVGKDEVTYSKSTSLQIWLFGYELADTLCVFCANYIYILAGKKKLQFLQPLCSELDKRKDLPELQMTIKVKNESDEESLRKIAENMKKSKSGKRVGVFRKDISKFTGSFVEGWRSAVEATKMAEVDVSAAFAYTSAPKDEAEVGLLRKACQHTCTIFSKFVKREIVTIVDDEKRVKHSKLAEDVELAITEGKFLPQGMDNDNVDICYSPIIQSGGKYQLKFSTVSSEERLHFGTIVCCLGVRYKSYCSNISRTMFVEPSQEKQDNYEFLLSLYDSVLKQVKEGVRMCDVYNSALDFIEKQKPHLKDHFIPSIGFATGIEFREGSLTFSPKCTLTIRKGMCFNINLGFSDLSDPQAKHSADRTYAMFIGDTVLAGDEDSPAVDLTAMSKKKLTSIAIFMGDEDEDQNGQAFPEQLDEVLRSKDRGTRTDQGHQAAGRRKEHQSELTRKMNQEARKRLLDNQGDSISKRPKLSMNIAYKHSSVVPRDADVQNHRIFVDRKYEAVVLPVFGVATPFHISTIKNISKSEEGEYVYLRVNFFHPGSSMGRIDGVLFPNPEATFVKELSFRASVQGGFGISLTNVFNLIKDVQKRFKTRELEKKELEGYVEQAALILSSGRGNPRLKDLYGRPIISGSRRTQGTLEAHTNGIRYTTIKGDKVDILYSNIKHAFFQPSKKQMIVLLHFHLKHPLIIGKKKHKDIQFYTEVGEIMTDLGRAQHMHDRDDLMAEQAERELRAKLDNAFDSFTKKVEGLPQCRIHFEKPFRELGFDGVPSRSTVFLQPTTNCLINVTDQPAFIITLDEVELVHFERVQFHMKNFDMVFIFKDYKRKVSMITAIPMTQLDSIKDWLNQCNIKYTEGVQSLNWTKIMKTINDDPEGFFDNGGWSFLDPESDAGEDDSESGESEVYAPSGESEVGSGSEEDDSDEDYSSVSEGSSESEYEASEDEESGMDWDELEEEAKKADKEREKHQESDEERHAHQRSRWKGKGSGPAKDRGSAKKRRR